MHHDYSIPLGTVLVGAEVQIGDGAHTITHISPIAQFSGYVYGTADKESYSFQIGARLAPINQVLLFYKTVRGCQDEKLGRIGLEL